VTEHEPHTEDHGHGHGSRFIQHHYEDAQHQFDSGKLAIWLFLAQEVLFFSALFVAYILYRVHHPEIYSYAHQYLQVKFGAINTAVLIFSSLTAAWAVRAAQLKQRALLIGCLATTILCACTFLGIKYLEYSHKYREHVLFGRYFDPCVSSGGTELLTKNNECEGSKSNVVWDPTTATPKSGCLENIDQDLHHEGVQASCEVDDVKLEHQKGLDGKDSIVEKPHVHIGTQCFEEEIGHEEVLQLEPLIKEFERIGYTPKRVADENLAVELAESVQTTPEQLSRLKKLGIVPTTGPKTRIFPCWRTAYQPAVCKKGVGILVEYGDTVERSNEEYKIKATCKPSPKAEVVADPLADTTNPLLLGSRAVQPAHQLTVHEEHELEAAGPPPEHTNMFFTVYFAMTGLHGVHVLVGIGVFIWLLIRAIRGDFTPDYYGPVDYAALYWHIVDLIWIFLFPLLYLIH
jgi:heme/copper-type cytochrome/quinol oxidase subunit 3